MPEPIIKKSIVTNFKAAMHLVQKGTQKNIRHCMMYELIEKADDYPNLCYLSG